MTCKNKEEKLEHVHTVKLQITMQGRTFLKTDCMRLRKGRHTDMYRKRKTRKERKKETERGTRNRRQTEELVRNRGQLT